ERRAGPRRPIVGRPPERNGSPRTASPSVPPMTSPPLPRPDTPPPPTPSPGSTPAASTAAPAGGTPAASTAPAASTGPGLPRVTELLLSAFAGHRGVALPLGALTLLTGPSGSGKTGALRAYEALARLGGG